MKLSLFFGAGTEADCGLPSGTEMAFDLVSDFVEANWKDIVSKISEVNGKSFRDYLNRIVLKNEGEIRYTRFQSQEISTLISSSIRRARNLLEGINDSENLKECLGKSGDEKVSCILDVLDSVISKAVGKDVKILPCIRKSLNADDWLRDLYQSIAGMALLILSERVFYPLDQILEIGDALGIESFREISRQDFEDILINHTLRSSASRVISSWHSNAGKLVSNCKEDDPISVSRKFLSNIFDYNDVVTSVYSHLSPQEFWSAKYQKAFAFQHRAWIYIQYKLAKANREECRYYKRFQDLRDDIVVVGTTNYTSLAKEYLGEVFYLNGSTWEFYDVKRHEIRDQVGGKSVVPLLLTQSHLRPFGSYKMKERYVEFFKKISEGDALLVIGYSFPTEDSDVVSMMRSYLRKVGKKIIVASYKENGSNHNPDGGRLSLVFDGFKVSRCDDLKGFRKLLGEFCSNFECYKIS